MGSEKSKPGSVSLAAAFPGVAEEWDAEKNAPLRPENVPYGARRRGWWRCREGHSWEAKVCSRTKKNGSGCPVCGRIRAVSGENDLQTLRPDLMEEWDWEKNENIAPDKLCVNSNRKVWWRCKRGHSWETGIINRSRAGHGCPYCSGRRAIPGENDLATVAPAITREWNREKNLPLVPEETMPMSNKKVWWKCGNGHEWQAMVSDRSSGKGCPYCSGRKSVAGEKDLLTLCPELAAEWDTEKNLPLTVHDVLPQSFKVVWWRCKYNHSWKARIQSRYFGRNCPYCSGRVAIPGETDLRTCHPELMSEWDEARNAPLNPGEIAVHSNQKVWWKCKYGHKWQSMVVSRTKGNGCPFCSGNIPIRTRLIEL